MAKLAIFIDGGYVDKLAQVEFSVWVDYQKLVAHMISCVASRTPEPVDLLRTYYYHCLPYQSNPPTSDEQNRYAQARSFFDRLQRLPRFQVREGRLHKIGINAAGEPVFQQKRVDLMLGLDFALLSGKRQITHAAMLAGDSDLLPAVEAAKQEGIGVWLFHGPRRSRKDSRPTYADELRTAADERIEIDRTFMDQVKRPKA